MGFSGQFFRALGVDPGKRGAVSQLSSRLGVPVSRLRYYNDTNVLPSGDDLDRILQVCGISEVELMLAMGRLSRQVLDALQAKAGVVADLIGSLAPEESGGTGTNLVMETALGRLYKGDCVALMLTMQSDSVDMIFADPPFNLNKLYPSSIDDNLKTERYLEWCEVWLRECVRLLKHGGSLFVWNLPKWNAEIASFLQGRLTFVHWIAVDIKYSLPIQGRLYPSHYSLLYFVKGGSARVFHPDRLPMQICPHCYGDLRDYGGYKDKMSPKGVNLTDVWWDISPVRHAKYKRRNGANELSLKILDRVIEMSTDEGDLVLDPFGGAGTTRTWPPN
jgi:DNA modification methylase